MLPAPLYLDTARLGTMSPGAQRLHNQFVRLAAEQPSSLYVEKFLRDGYSSWPADYRQRYSGLTLWDGIAGLQSQLAQTIAPHVPGRVLLASRSVALMKLASRRLCERCRHILTTDLSWRPYQRILQSTSRRCGETCVTTVSVRRSILRNGVTPEELTDQLANAFVRHRCDGLFLPVVDNFGIRLPIASVVTAIRRRADVRFVVADAAQALNHVALDADAAACDMLIAGTHKWLRAYLPMGIGWLNARPSSDGTGQLSRLSEESINLNEPLFDFTEQLTGGSLRRHSETVNLAPLFACRGALDDTGDIDCSASLFIQKSSADRLSQLAIDAGWRPLIPAESFRTGILLLQHREPSARRPQILQRALLECDVVVSAYRDGLVRVSMPQRRLQGHEWQRLESALRATSLQSTISTRAPEMSIQSEQTVIT